MSKMNRIHNSNNPYQGNYKKVLGVCSAGLLRSPTAAVVLSQPPYNFNTRAAGIVPDYALIPVDEVLLAWADEVVCMTADQIAPIKALMMRPKPIICLNIEDSHPSRDPDLIAAIRTSYDEKSKPADAKKSAGSEEG